MNKEDQSPIIKDRTLKGHRAGIQCIAISPDGATVLSGDDDAWLLVWNVATGEIVQKISTPFNGAIGAVVWTPHDADGISFVFGCADGSLHLYRERQNSRGPFEVVSVLESPGPIESLTFDRAHQRLASVGGGCLQVWKFTDLGSLTPLNEDMVRKSVVAKNVVFTDDGASVVVFYLESHEIACYSVEPWDLKWSKIIPTRIGNAGICSADGVVLYISNLCDGIDQYRFPSLEKIQSFTHPISVNLPLQVAPACRGQWVLCGGDSGFVRVFSRRTGQIIQILDHCEKCLPVQVVATHELGERSLIITGASGEGESDLQIWYERTFDPLPLPGAYTEGVKGDNASFASTMKAIIIYAFLAVFAIQLVMIGFLYLFWPQIKTIIEALLDKSSLATDLANANLASVQIPSAEPPSLAYNIHVEEQQKELSDNLALSTSIPAFAPAHYELHTPSAGDAHDNQLRDSSD